MTDFGSIDLICRARRFPLSSDDQRRVDTLLRTSPAARLEDALLAGFERESVVQRGDDARVARIVATAVGRLCRPGARIRRLRWLGMAAAVLVAGGAAAAWRAYHRSASPVSPLGTASRPAPVEPAGVSARPPSRVPSVALDAPLSDAESAAPAPASHQAPSGLERKAKTNSVQAPELFAEANLLRRRGRTGEACARYRILLAHHPAAREAPPARLALAKLLAGSRPAEALDHYRRVAVQRGPLQAEALWGVVETARRLGQSAAEERALAKLVELYPESPYAEAARTRGADGRE
ncbi:MAG: hypothetical protein JW940_30880 [Polyangiaceae bacterium]|nr:hypothetical protein [Polyangiaceae bacterium]